LPLQQRPIRDFGLKNKDPNFFSSILTTDCQCRSLWVIADVVILVLYLYFITSFIV